MNREQNFAMCLVCPSHLEKVWGVRGNRRRPAKVCSSFQNDALHLLSIFPVSVAVPTTVPVLINGRRSRFVGTSIYTGDAMDTEQVWSLDTHGSTQLFRVIGRIP
ncbi:unnamed protein product, partial [Scytosiphon promiscuus]